jgi:hypothetical protein
LGGRDQEDQGSTPAQANRKYSAQKWLVGVVQVVEQLPFECEALSSNPSTAKKKKKKLHYF